MITLTEFLEARLAEDEKLATDADRWIGTKYDPLRVAAGDTLNLRLVELYREYRTDRVLREVKAKRAIAAQHRGPHECPAQDRAWGNATDYVSDDCNTVRHVATIYADHPDYRSEWALPAMAPAE